MIPDVKRITIPILLLLVTCESFSQNWEKFYNQASAFFENKEYGKAVAPLKKALEFAQKEIGESNKNYSDMLGAMAYLYKNLHQYDVAEVYYKQQIAIEQTILEEDDPDLGITIRNLAHLYDLKKQFKKAEQYYRMSIEEIRRTAGKDHIYYALRLNDLALFYKQRGDYDKAEPLYLQAKKAIEDIPEDLSRDYSLVLFNLGSLYAETGQYEKAEPLFIEAEEIRRQLLTPSDPDYTIVINALGALYTDMGLYEKGISFFEQTLTFVAEAEETDSLDYAVCLNNLAGAYSLSGEYDQAEIYLAEANRIKKKLLRKTEFSFIAGLQNQADLYALRGKFNEAEKIYLQVLNNFRTSSDTVNGYYAVTLDAMGSLYSDMDKDEKAELFYKRARDLRRKLFGENHQTYLSTIHHMISLYIIRGQYEKAEPLIIKGNELMLSNTQKHLFILSEKEKNEYVRTNYPALDINNNYLYKLKKVSPTINKKSFQSHLSLKALSLDQTRALLLSLQDNKDTAIKELYDEWISNKRYLAEQYSVPRANRDPDLKYTEAKTEIFEKELGRKSSEFNFHQSSIQVSLKDMQENLQADEAVIEFVSFKIFNRKWTDTVMYAAYILNSKDSFPVFIPLIREIQLQELLDSAGKTTESMVRNFYRGIIVESNNNVGLLGQKLYNLIWSPLEPYLKGIKKISYSPAGKLYNIAFHALPLDSATILMDKYELQQYMNTRQVALRVKESQIMKPTEIYLFGNASFTMDSLQLINQRNEYSKKENITTNIYTPQNRDSRSGTWNNLPGTAEEISKIMQLFDQNKSITKAFTNTAASEENLKALNGNSPQILHIATHGFFLPEPEKKKKEKNFSENNAYTLADDPLLRSGLILAGGNYAWSGKMPIEGVEDGIVTAYEISQLNFSNTELVVLSACETALGDVKGSEGVFGLQRAFKMAGVKKMIVSLWQVPDKETAELMTAFYSYWMKGKTINDAFTQAQADMRKKYSPFYWAAFVLIE